MRKRNEGGALIGALVAEIEDARDGENARRSGREPMTLILSPSAHAEVLGELGADQDVLGQHAWLAGDDVVGDAHDLEIDVRVDARSG